MKEFLVGGLRQLVEQTAGEFEPGLLNAFTAERAVAEWAAIERVACAAKLRSAARAEEVGLDAEQAVSSSSGITSGQARKQTRLSRKLRDKKKTSDAFNKGRLSPTQADAIADAVDADPRAEDTLLGMAAEGASATELLNECERIKRDAMDADGSLAGRQHQARSLRHWTDAMGMTCLSGRLEPVVGAKIIAELGAWVSNEAPILAFAQDRRRAARIEKLRRKGGRFWTFPGFATEFPITDPRS